MRKAVFLLLPFLLLGFMPPPFARHGNTAVTFDIKKDFHAACDGITNDDAAFTAAHAAMISDQRVVKGANVILTVPSGSGCTFKSCSGNYFSNLNDFTLAATGAVFTSTGGCAQLGNGNLDSTNVGGRGSSGQAEQPIQTVSAGATCVTMTTAADAAFYTTGRWTLIGALGLQGSGYPPNFGLWEYLQVASSNAGTGQVCFNTPLVNSYNSTWTDLGDTNCSGWACGGNPRLYLMETGWAHTFTVIGGTWHWDQPLLIVSQNVFIINSTFIGLGGNTATCQTPTLSQTVTFNNVTNTTCVVDADKEVQNWTVNGGHLNNVQFQTTSFANITMNNGAIIDFLNGLPQTTNCNNSTISGMFIGSNYGASKSFAGNVCTITSSNTFPIRDNYLNPGECADVADHTFCRLTSITSGAMVVTNVPIGFNTGLPPQWWVPGTVMTFSNTQRNSGFQFTVADNSCGSGPGGPHGAGGASGCLGGTVTVNTTGYPPGSGFPPGDVQANYSIIPDLMRNWSCTNCTGSAIARDLSQASAQNQPLFTYSSRTYTCTANLPNVPGASDLNHPQDYGILGNFGSVTINVSTADTGPNGTFTVGTDQFGRIPITNQSTGVNGGWGYAVNAKIAGTRTITPTAVTGAQSGDSGTFPGANTWFAADIGTSGGLQEFTSVDLTAEAAGQCPVVTITFQASR